MGVPAGGSPPVVGGEGGCPRSLPDPGRAHVYVTVGGNSPELVSGVAGTPSSSFGEATGSAAGGAAAVGTLGGEGGCPRSLPDPGRAHVYVTVGGNSLELVSGVAGTPSLSFSVL